MEWVTNFTHSLLDGKDSLPGPSESATSPSEWVFGLTNISRSSLFSFHLLYLYIYVIYKHVNRKELTATTLKVFLRCSMADALVPLLLYIFAGALQLWISCNGRQQFALVLLMVDVSEVNKNVDSVGLCMLSSTILEQRRKLIIRGVDEGHSHEWRERRDSFYFFGFVMGQLILCVKWCN